MAEFSAMPLWTDAYLGDTTHLTTIEHGAYLLLLMTAWRSKDGCLPNDDKLLSRYTRMTVQQWLRIRPTIERFFTIEDGCWWQSRLTDERVALKKNSKRQSDKSKARWLKTKKEDDAAGMPSEEPKICRSDPEDIPPLPLPLPIPTELSKDNSSPVVPKISPPEIQMAFERFWNAYPGVGKDGHAGAAFKGSKETARKAFEKILKKEKDYAGLTERIVAACREYGEHLARSGYPSRHCSTWLTGKCWEDDYSSVTQPTRPNTNQQAKPYSHTVIDAAERAKQQLRTQGSRGFNAADQLAALEQRGAVPRCLSQGAGPSGHDHRALEATGGAQADGSE